MARTTTPPSWSTPTVIASRHISAVRRLGGIGATAQASVVQPGR
jgi:hypothetical protein